jgi:Lon protease-like protein
VNTEGTDPSVGATAMFPLGTVVFPGQPIPLHVFEERYRAMLRDCLAGDRTFGVVLIERGSEVGGGDVRTSVGTLASIVEAEELPDGRWAVVAVGTRRIRVQDWLDDDPYPRAVVDLLDDELAGPDAYDRLPDLVALLRRTLALRAELGDPAPSATFELDEDPTTAVWQAGALSMLGPLDRQRLLAIDGLEARMDLLGGMLLDEADLLARRLRS